ncbi:MAG: hypothetical protein GXN92_01255 [Candidatus Micrarchaeota archaeon]|nr:hypothetical protein [Candidatus Micrarchaeota archaeon]
MIEKLKDWKVQLAVLLVLIALYVLTKHPLVGVITVIFIVVAFIVELKENAKEKGWKEELKDMVVLFIIIFLGLKLLGVVLNTEAPLSAIPTCSMEPTYHRGDVIVAAGWPVETMYHNGTFGEIEIYYNGTLLDVSIPMWSYCKSNPFSIECREFRSCPSCFEERYGDLSVYYDFCYRGEEKEICSVAYSVKGEKYPFNYSTDTIIYKPLPDSLFGPYGLVVHRALFALCNSTECLYFTKGDNNNVFDFQYYFHNLGNPPVKEEQIVGKVIFRIPYLGYPRIFLSGYVQEDPYCKVTLK